MGQTFSLFSCRAAIRRIILFGDPSSSSGYGSSQPFCIQVCSSWLYSAQMCAGAGYSDSLVFNITGGWAPDHFYDVIHIHLLVSNSAWKSSSLMVMAVQIGLGHWGSFTSPVLVMDIPASCLIASRPSNKSNPSISSSTIKASMSIEGLLLMSSQTTPTTQHLRVFPSTVRIYTSFLSYAWQHALHMTVWVQPVFTRAMHLIPSICTVIVDSCSI